MKYRSPINVPVRNPEVRNKMDPIVEKNHNSITDQVKRFKKAGDNLVSSRRMQSGNVKVMFDFAPGVKVPKDYIDHTRRKGFDATDAQILDKIAKEDIEEGKVKAKKKLEEIEKEKLDKENKENKDGDK